MTPPRRLAAAALLMGTCTAIGGCGLTDPYAQRRAPISSTAVAATSPGRPQLDRQDQVSRAHRRREAQAMARRPLLDHLPVTVDGIRITIAGLARDDRATLLRIDPGTASAAHARAVYRGLLAAFGDPGTAYRPRVRR